MTVLFNQLGVERSSIAFAGDLSKAGLSSAELNEARSLARRLSVVLPRNKERTLWYEAKHAVQHLGIAVPKQLESVAPVVGWPARAVDDLSERCVLDGMVAAGDAWESLALDDVWADNRMPLLSTQVQTSAFKYSVTFVAPILGGDGETPVMVRAYSATTSTGRWSATHGRLESFFTVTGKDLLGAVTGFILVTDEAHLICDLIDGKWVVDRRTHPAGRCPVSVIVHNPSVENAYGTSRITRPVMSIAQRAVRSLLRMEVTAEFYSSPQRAVLGADESDFVDAETGQMKTGWEVTIGKLLALGRDEEGNLPTVQQFQQASMQPHVDMVRSDAAMFSGETGIPVDTLGIIHDNPSSAEGVNARYQKLNAAAEKANLSFGDGWADVMRLAVILRDGDARAADDLRGLTANYRPPHTPSIGEASNAMVQQISAVPWIGETTVALRRLGYSASEIQEMNSDRRRSGVSQLVEQLRGGVNVGNVDGSGSPATVGATEVVS